MTTNETIIHRVCLSAKRALTGQTPASLRAYSFAVNSERKEILLRAHFEADPSEDDLEDISVVETEIDADFLDHFEGRTEIEIVPAAEPLSFLSGGVAYLRSGEAGTCCS